MHTGLMQTPDTVCVIYVDDMRDRLIKRNKSNRERNDKIHITQ